jgi:dienelactone hydrolase
MVIKSAHGAFHAYIARPAKLPSPAVVVLQELFGVNADIRATCDELATQGSIAVAPDLFWRQEPGVDLAHSAAGLAVRLSSVRQVRRRAAAGFACRVREAYGKRN